MYLNGSIIVYRAVTISSRKWMLEQPELTASLLPVQFGEPESRSSMLLYLQAVVIMLVDVGRLSVQGPRKILPF